MYDLFFDEVMSWHIGMCERACREQILATVDKMCAVIKGKDSIPNHLVQNKAAATSSMGTVVGVRDIWKWFCLVVFISSTS